MRDPDLDQLPELYTQRELEKKTKRQRMLGRLEGGVAVAGAATVLAMVGNWIPTLLIVSVVAYILYRVLSKSKKNPTEE